VKLVKLAQEVRRDPIRVPCTGCGSRADYADLDGPAFNAYYCQRCVEMLQAVDVDPQEYRNESD
jgi:hypothetical protein